MSSISVSATSAPRQRSSLRFWRAPGQPGWVLPALLLILVCAGVLYCWGLNGGMYNTFYASAARSMSESWKAFLFGSFSPANAITIDKIPGYLWPQAVSARLFGFEAWSVVLPQVIEAFVTVLVTYRLVRRWAGDVAAVLTAAFLALTPAVVASGHTNNEEAAYVMCLALAASATQRAVTVGRLRSLALAGVWTGLAFQCKMVEAWALLPVIAVTYLVAAPLTLRRRVLDVVVAALVTLAVSLTWVVTVALVPTGSRPYIDGTTNNNPFSMVFGYNALTRFGSLGITPASVGAVSQHGGGAAGAASAGGLTTMFQAAQATQVGWLYPLAAVSIAVLLWQRRRQPRTDPIRAIVVMWTAWVAVYGLAYSAGSIHSYYVLTLAPALAALSGTGAVALWRLFRAGGRGALALPVTIALTAGWGIYIAHGFPSYRWLLPGLAAAGIAGLAALAVAWRGPAAAGRWAAAAAAVIAALVVLIGPIAWDSSVITAGNTQSLAMGNTGPSATTLGFGGDAGFGAVGHPGFGPGSVSGSHGGFGGGFGLGGGSVSRGGLGGRSAGGGAAAGAGNGLWVGNGTLTAAERGLLDYVEEHRDGARYVLTTTSVYEASTYILRASADVLSVGGFTGQAPSPTLAQFEQYVAGGEVRYVYLTTLGGGPGTPRQTGQAGQAAASQIEAWVPAHCSTVSASDYDGTSTSNGAGTLYECSGS